MVNRFVEVMALALLVVLTVGTTFQVLNYQLLRELQQEIRAERRSPAAMVRSPLLTPPPPAPAPASAAPVVVAPAPAAAPEAQQLPAPPSPPAQAAVADPQSLAEREASPPSVEAPEPTVAADALAQSPEWQEYGPTVREVIDQLFSGGVQPIVERLTKDVAGTLTAEVLRDAARQAVSKHGQPRPASESQPTEIIPTGSDLLTFRVRLATDQAKALLLSVSLTRDKKIAGLLFRPIE